MTQSTLPVIQADRDAAADYLAKRIGDDDPMVAHVRAGGQDHDNLVKLCARVRIEHSTPDRNAVLESALRECADKLWVLRCNSRDADDRQAAERACDMATAALTTTPEPTDPAGVSELAEKLDRIADEAMMDRYGMANRAGSDWGWARRTAEIALRTPSPVLEVAKEALEKARHRLLKEGFLPADPTVSACNAALQAIKGDA